MDMKIYRFLLYFFVDKTAPVVSKGKKTLWFFLATFVVEVNSGLAGTKCPLQYCALSYFMKYMFSVIKTTTVYDPR